MTVGEGVVETIAWYATAPHGPMPASLASMDPAEQKRTVAAVKALVDRHGTDGAMGIAAGVADDLRGTDS